jgi:hypothetical protein
MTAFHSHGELGFAKSLAIVVAVTIGVLGYLAIGTLLVIKPMYAGFFFALYWGGIKQSKFAELAPSLGGALGGLLVAWLLHILPLRFGSIGAAIAAALPAIALYLLINRRAPQIFNLAFMLLLLTGSIPAIALEEDFLGMAESVLLAAAYLGGIMLLTTRLTKAKAIPHRSK